jgi:hypothetical protein
VTVLGGDIKASQSSRERSKPKQQGTKQAKAAGNKAGGSAWHETKEVSEKVFVKSQ